MITLYHNAASSCSQKVRLVLAEKELDYESRIVDLMSGDQHAAEYARLNPGHVVPTLVHDGYVAVESTLINEYLDDAFPERPLRPPDAAGRHAMRLWTRRIDDLHPNAGVVTYGIGTRPLLLARDQAELEAQIAQMPDARARAARRSVIRDGVAAPEMAEAIRAFCRVLDEMEESLETGVWLAGPDFSLADAAALPYVMRLDHLAMGPLIDARARVADWYTRVQARPGFERAIGAWLPAPIVDLFRRNGAAVWDEVAAIAAGG